MFHQFKAPAGFYTKPSLSYYLNPLFFALKYFPLPLFPFFFFFGNVITPLSFNELLLCVIMTLSFTLFLDSAFCKADHGLRLDHFFCLFFQQLIQPSRLRDGSSAPHPDVSGTLFLDGLPAVRWLTLPPEIKVR